MSKSRYEICTLMIVTIKEGGVFFNRADTLRWQAIIEADDGKYSIADSPPFRASPTKGDSFVPASWDDFHLIKNYREKTNRELLADGWELIEKQAYKAIYRRLIQS
jgi:hypothetical protein